MQPTPLIQLKFLAKYYRSISSFKYVDWSKELVLYCKHQYIYGYRGRIRKSLSFRNWKDIIITDAEWRPVRHALLAIKKLYSPL